MLEMFSSLGIYHYFYAALLALCITYIIMKLLKFRTLLAEEEFNLSFKGSDRKSVMAKCTRLFPIETFNFKGMDFKKGMTVRITTTQQKVFQGEFIGKNNLNVICILAGEHVIAHDVEKIKEMISLDEIK